MRHQLSLAALLAVLFVTPSAMAQQPAAALPPPAPAANSPSGGTPDAIPFDIPYGTSIGGDRAKQVLAAAEAEAKRRNWKMNIAIADTNGELVHFLRMDGAQIASVVVAQGKARTAARFRRPTQTFYNAAETGHPYVATLDSLVASPGGFPLVEGGKLIGAIGCSGGTGDQDAAVCKVSAETIK